MAILNFTFTYKYTRVKQTLIPLHRSFHRQQQKDGKARHERQRTYSVCVKQWAARLDLHKHTTSGTNPFGWPALLVRSFSRTFRKPALSLSARNDRHTAELRNLRIWLRAEMVGPPKDFISSNRRKSFKPSDTNMVFILCSPKKIKIAVGGGQGETMMTGNIDPCW